MTEAAATTTDKIDAFLEKLVALGGELVEGAKPFAKVATEATFTAIHFNGMFSLVGGVVALGLAAGSAWATCKLARALSDASWNDELPPLLGTIVFGLVGIVCLFIGVAALTSADTWMALLRPDAYLAAKALGL